MESQNNNSEALFIFKCVSKQEMIVFEIDTDDGKLDISNLFFNFGVGTAPGALNVERMPPEEDIPSLRRSRKRIKPKEDTKSPAFKKRRPITSEHRRGNTDPPAAQHNKSNTFSCCDCRYKTNNKNRLTKHLKMHSTVDPHLTRQTGEKSISRNKYIQRVNLPNRLWTYIGEKPYTCDKCDFKCIRKLDLKLHLMNHTGKKPLKCDRCSFICNVKITLKHHLMTHTGEKPFACNKCDFKCNHKGSLTHHLRTHTGEKPYACDICDFKCSQNSNLKRHLLSHSDKKPFACKRCDYKSSRKDNLKQHLLTHSGEKPFVCGDCDYKCCDKRALNKHMLKVHGVSN